ncbi:MAG: sigma-70 family RNA polymerase sigma factor [Coriobacteriia bacterium]|nr:sigma-70 family RNA polymerase sigma factor [Coriobacteriia bacterium]
MTNQMLKKEQLVHSAEVNRDPAAVRAQEKLIRRSASGNNTALKELCQSITKNVSFRVSRKISNQEEAEDVTQEILVRVYENIHNLKDPKAFGGWLNTIINNEISRYYAKNKKHRVVLSMEEYLDSIVDDESDDYVSHEYEITDEERKRIIAIIDTLPERQLEAVILHYYEGMSVTQTAEVMGVTKQVVSIHLIRAREKIKTALYRQQQPSALAHSLAATPIGALLTQALNDEAALIADTGIALVASGAAGIGIAKSSTASTAAASIAGKTSTFFAGVVTAAATTVLVFTGLWAGGAFEEAAPVETAGEIVFSGGESALHTVNPATASAWATNERGDLSITHWWITKTGSAIVLLSGDGSDVNGIFAHMREKDEGGNYTLWFAMEDKAGSSYTLHREFIVATDEF